MPSGSRLHLGRWDTFNLVTAHEADSTIKYKIYFWFSGLLKFFHVVACMVGVDAGMYVLYVCVLNQHQKPIDNALPNTLSTGSKLAKPLKHIIFTIAILHVVNCDRSRTNDALI